MKLYSSHLKSPREDRTNKPLLYVWRNSLSILKGESSIEGEMYIKLPRKQTQQADSEKGGVGEGKSDSQWGWVCAVFFSPLSTLKFLKTLDLGWWINVGEDHTQITKLLTSLA